MMSGMFALAVAEQSAVLFITDIVGFLAFFAIASKCTVLARRRRAMLVLQGIDHALRMNAPLPTMLDAAAKSEASVVSDMLGSVSDSIAVGMPVADALEIARCGVSERVIGLIRASEESGRLQPQLERIITEERRVARSESIDSVLMLVYPAFVVPTLLATIGAMSIFVLPRFERIFDDFDAQLPTITVWFFRTAEPFGPIVLGFAALLGILFILKIVRDLSDVGPLTLPGQHWLAWHVPIWRSSVRSRAYADAFALMADSLEAGQTLPVAFEHAETGASNRVFQQKLGMLRHAFMEGATPSQAKHIRQLPELAVNMISTGYSSNLPDVMRFLARHYRGRFSRFATFMRSTMMPAIVLILAGVVGVFVVAVFLPLVQLIESVTAVAL